MSGVLYINNSNVVELVGLTNSVTGVEDTGASVSVTLLGSDGTPVTGETWPLVLSHAASGTYRATLAHDVSINASHKYTAKINATGSGGEVGEWSCAVLAEVRGCE